MAEPITPQTAPAQSNPVQTGQMRVACGGPAHGRHPKVFLTMVDDKNGKPSHVVCPYCSQAFHYNPTLATKTNHH
ncbi:MAG: zinc-finger domain-containing protein [Proteobacteria bacterium]|nr:zinc-finger domain-containing protein [Pseudomonadota bacterium]NBX85633.1 zinc-finger domain-containing protein [Pseudomonadota bacterium]